MVGNVIQSKFLELIDYPAAASLSFILMALILAALLVYARARRHGEADGLMRWIRTPPAPGATRSSRSAT